MGKVSLVVELKRIRGRRDAFVKRARRHAEICRREEPGCLHFDVLVPHDDSERAFLYETYADQAAVEIHMATAHMAEYRRDTDPMIVERTRTFCDLIKD